MSTARAEPGDGAPTEESPMVCTRCGGPCLPGSRYRDEDGLYVCRACWEAALTKGPHGEVPIGEPHVEEVRRCPVCFHPMGAQSPVCMMCGYSRDLGVLSSRLVKPRRRDGVPVCAECGYDLRGLRGLRCPECGTPIPMSTRRSTRAPGPPVWVAACVKPLIMLGIGAIIGGLWCLIAGGPLALLGYAVILGAMTVVGLVVFQVCAVVWIGFESPWWFRLAGLASVYAVTSVIWLMLVSVIPILFLPHFLAWFLHVWLISETLEVDVPDAAFVGTLTGAVFLVLAVVSVWNGWWG